MTNTPYYQTLCKNRKNYLHQSPFLLTLLHHTSPSVFLSSHCYQKKKEHEREEHKPEKKYKRKSNKDKTRHSWEAARTTNNSEVCKDIKTNEVQRDIPSRTLCCCSASSRSGRGGRGRGRGGSSFSRRARTTPSHASAPAA